MKELKITLDWFANTNHTGLLLAQKLGWYADAGLDVRITGKVHGNMNLHGSDIVMGPEIAMLDCMEQGIGMTGIAVLTQKCDSGIVSLKEEGITSPRKLEGKRLSHWTPQWFHAAIRRIVEADGGDYDKVIKVPMDVGDIVSVLGRDADATWVYENWENFVLREAGKEINYFNLGDIDPIFDFCAPAVAASHEVLKRDPDAIRTFLSVTDRGYRQAAAEPAKAVLTVRDLLPAGVSDDLLAGSQRHLAGILLDEKGRWGRIKPERWNRMADFVMGQGVISRRRPDEFTNEYFED